MSKLRGFLKTVVPVLTILLGSCFLAEVIAQPQMPSSQKGYMMFQQAMQHFRAKDYAGAIKLFKKCNYYMRSDKRLYHYMALAYSEMGNVREAESLFKQALNWDANYVECRNNYGLLLKNRGKLDLAKMQFDRCIRINPRYPYAYHHLGEIYQERGDLENAIKNYETATRLKPDYFDAQRDLGLAYYERSRALDITSSLDKLIAAARLVPDNPMIHYYIGKVFCAKGNLDDAEAAFRTSLMYDARLAAAHYELGKVRYHRGDPERCIEELKQAQRINPTYTKESKYPRLDPLKTKILIGKAYEHSGDLISAVETWKEVADLQYENEDLLKKIKNTEKLLRRNARRGRKRKKDEPFFDPAEVAALVKKGQRQYDDGNLDGARSTFDRALSMNPGSFQAMQNLGFTLEAMGDLGGAMSKYQSALELNPDFDGAYYNLAYVLEKMDLPADAGMMYQRFHEKAGRYPYDSKHIVALQQDDARRRAREELRLKRGY